MIIVKAEYIEDYKIRVVFKDGTIKIADFKPFLSKTHLWQVKKFLDKELFKKFKVEYGVLRWGDNQFDIGPASIYNGDFDIKTKCTRTTKKTTIN